MLKDLIDHESGFLRLSEEVEADGAEFLPSGSLAKMQHLGQKIADLRDATGAPTGFVFLFA